MTEIFLRRIEKITRRDSIRKTTITRLQTIKPVEIVLDENPLE